MIELTTDIAFAALGLGLLLVLVRIIRGPTLADRILALDLLTTLGAGIIGVFAIRSGEYLFVDVAVALVVISFVSTAAFARYLLSRSEK